MAEPSFVFRLTPYNRNSIAALLGFLRKRAAGHVRLSVMKSEADATSHYTNGPEFIAYSFTTWMQPNVYSEIQRLKKIWPRTIFLAGGSHASGNPQSTLNMGFDFVFVGEGETSLWYFIQEQPVNARPGIIPSGEPVALDDIEALVPAHGLYPPLEITRGCWHACRYCQTPAIFHPPVRHRSTESVRYWVRQAVLGGIRQIRFVSPDAFGYQAQGPGRRDASAIESLLSLAEEFSGISFYFGSFPSQVRPENCRSEILRLVKRYCKNRRIVIGAQTGSDRQLNDMQRGHETDTILEACHVIREQGLTPVVDFMFGLPGEKEADREATRFFITLLVKKYAAIIRGHSFVPLPGTAWAEADKTPVDLETYRLMETLETRGQAEGEWRQPVDQGVV